MSKAQKFAVRLRENAALKELVTTKALDDGTLVINHKTKRHLGKLFFNSDQLAGLTYDQILDEAQRQFLPKSK
jgi:hypothetical protein